MNRWFIKIKAWQGELASLERFVWLSYLGIPLNAWNSTMFKRIGEVWGHFVKMDDETMRDTSFAKGKILIATEECKKIEKWIRVEVQGVNYEILVRENASFVSPYNFENLGEMEEGVGFKKILVEKQGKGSKKLGPGEREEKDVEVESQVQETANKSGVVGGLLRKHSRLKGTSPQVKGMALKEMQGSMLNFADKHLMLKCGGNQIGSKRGL